MIILNPSDLQRIWKEVMDSMDKLIRRNLIKADEISKIQLLVEPISKNLEQMNENESVTETLNIITNFMVLWNRFSNFIHSANFFDFAKDIEFLGKIVSEHNEIQGKPLIINILKLYSFLQLLSNEIQTKKDYNEIPSIVPISMVIGSLIDNDLSSIPGLTRVISSLQSKVHAYCSYSDLIQQIDFFERSLHAFSIEVVTTVSKLNQLMEAESLTLISS